MINRLKNKSIRVARELLAMTPVGKSLFDMPDRFILMYHGVSATSNTIFNKRHVPVTYFEKQLRFLKKYTHVLSVKDFFEGNFVSGRPNCAITFDDGYLNNYTRAFPLLEAYQCPATFYVTGMNEIGDQILWADLLNIAVTLVHDDVFIDGETYINTGLKFCHKQSGKPLDEVLRYEQPGYEFKKKVIDAFDKYNSLYQDTTIREFWQLMSDEQIRDVSRSSYVKIGSHGYFHNNLGSVSLQLAIDELMQSKVYLENLTQQPIKELAYPDGSYTPQVVTEAMSMGYHYQLAADRFLFGESDTAYFKKRSGVYHIDSPVNQLLNVLN